MYTIYSNRKKYVSQQLCLICSSLSDQYRPGYKILCPQNMPKNSQLIPLHSHRQSVETKTHMRNYIQVVQQYQKPFPRPTGKETHFNDNTQQQEKPKRKNASLSYKNIHDPFPSLVRPRVLSQIEARVEG